MSTKFIVTQAALALLSSLLLAQQKPASPAPTMREFPVNLRQNVEAGKTPVGTKVQAKLVMATLVDGTVIPDDALLSGEVVESVGKTKTDPSRLAIRLDTAEWKHGSALVKVYLTGWFYPRAIAAPGQDLSYGPQAQAGSSRGWNGAGTYPDGNPVSQPFPTAARDNDAGSIVPDVSRPALSGRPTQLKNVEAVQNADGVTTLVSSHSNIKLDKSTVYMFAAKSAVSPARQTKR